MVETYKLFDLSHTKAIKFLEHFDYPWVALADIGQFIESLGQSLDKKDYKQIAPQVWVHKSAEVAPSAFLKGPCIIGEECEIRHCAFIRGKVLAGNNSTIGNSVEIKNSILFDGVQVPHFNYVGDSILGYKAHLGAGVITSNLKSSKTSVFIKNGHESIYTGLRKVGAFVGDNVEVGCNSVLNPGTVIGKDTIIYPMSNVRGVVPENKVYKNKNEIIERY